MNLKSNSKTQLSIILLLNYHYKLIKVIEFAQMKEMFNTIF